MLLQPADAQCHLHPEPGLPILEIQPGYLPDPSESIEHGVLVDEEFLCRVFDAGVAFIIGVQRFHEASAVFLVILHYEPYDLVGE